MLLQALQDEGKKPYRLLSPRSATVNKLEEALLHSMRSDQRQAEDMQPAAGMLMHRMEGKRPFNLTTIACC